MKSALVKTGLDFASITSVIRVKASVKRPFIFSPDTGSTPNKITSPSLRLLMRPPECCSSAKGKLAELPPEMADRSFIFDVVGAVPLRHAKFAPIPLTVTPGIAVTCLAMASTFSGMIPSRISPISTINMML